MVAAGVRESGSSIVTEADLELSWRPGWGHGQQFSLGWGWKWCWWGDEVRRTPGKVCDDKGREADGAGGAGRGVERTVLAG